MTTNYLHNLNSKQLISFLKHIQLGDDHLSRILSRKEYNNLLSIGSLSNNQILKMKTDHQEKIGNVSVVVNTILTSCFGAWLGFNAFNNSSIVSYFGIIIIVLAAIFGFLVGYLSYFLTHYQAKLAIKKQRLCNVQQLIIDIINNKRRRKIENLQKKIHLLLINLDPIQNNKYKNSERDILNGILNLNLRSKPEFTLLFNKLNDNLMGIIDKLILINSDKKLLKNSEFDAADFLMNNALTNASYIKTLTKVDITSNHQIPKLNNWLRKYTPGILVGLIPTFLGTFASMFVFLNGFPAFFDSLGIHFGFSLFQIVLLKRASLFLAFGVSLYFAYSHLHSNYNAFKRAKQLEMSENIIAEKSILMIRLMSQLYYWGRIYYQMVLIKELHSHLSSANFDKNELYSEVMYAGDKE